MCALQNIERESKKYGIRTSRIDRYTLKLYSKKYLFDSWLVVKDKDNLELHHMNRRVRGSGKLQYHLQANIKCTNWIWVLQRISSHNRYVVSRKWNARENIVDVVMKKYKEGYYESGTKI